MYGLTVVTPPAIEPVDLDTAKRQLRIDHAVEDADLTRRIRAARELAEKHCGKAWLTQTLRLTLPGWPCGLSGSAGWLWAGSDWGWLAGWRWAEGETIRLPVEPVQSITSVQYSDVSGVLQTFPSGSLQSWLDHSP